MAPCPQNQLPQEHFPNNIFGMSEPTKKFKKIVYYSTSQKNKRLKMSCECCVTRAERSEALLLETHNPPFTHISSTTIEPIVLKMCVYVVLLSKTALF